MNGLAEITLGQRVTSLCYFGDNGFGAYDFKFIRFDSGNKLYMV